MQFSQDKPTHRYVFQETNDTGIVIVDMTENKPLFQSTSFIISVDEHIIAWNVSSVKQLSAESLAPLMDGQPDVVLLGCGMTPVILPPSIIALFWERRIGLECMTTPAAARTYNILANEGRKVIIGIILGKPSP